MKWRKRESWPEDGIYVIAVQIREICRYDMIYIQHGCAVDKDGEEPEFGWYQASYYFKLERVGGEDG